MGESKAKKIFISHASEDTQIGEKFLDAIIELGISKSDVFYSSQYHTGVQLGQDFHTTVWDALNNAEIVIFLLTRSFYKSPYCLNEMGATWIKGTNFVPILLDGLAYADMVGFVDSRHIAFKPDPKEAYKILSALKPYIPHHAPIIDLENAFNDFIGIANTMAANTAKMLPPEEKNMSDTEKMLLSGRFTEGEVLLFIFFLLKSKNKLDCSDSYNEETDEYKQWHDMTQLELYSAEHSLNYSNAMDLLVQSGLARYTFGDYSEEPEYYVLNIETFRDLLSLSMRGKEYIDAVKIRNYHSLHTENPARPTVESGAIKKTGTFIEQYILRPKLKEIEALLFQYMIDNTKMNLGDRWMAENEKTTIRLWEDSRDLRNILSREYDAALRSFIYNKLVKVESVTSYGNPREYKLEEEYIEQLTNLSDEATAVLQEVIQRNTVEPEEELPF